MNTPINHHYVSRCQSNLFFNKKYNKIFVLDKKTNRIYSKQTTKTLFSEDDSNTKTNDDLSIDRISLEKDLKLNFEDHFDRHVKVIRDLINDPKNPPIGFRESLESLTKFGIIGELRNPLNKKGTDNLIGDSLFNQILPVAAPELKAELLELKDRLSKTKYSNSILYSEHAEQVFKLMGNINCLIYSIDCNKFFFLPDVSSIRFRAKINTYFNPDIREIAMVGIPLSSKIFLHAQSVKLGQLDESVYRITEEFPGEIERINFGLFDNSYEQIACEDIDYLTKFRDNLEVIKEFSLR